MLRVLCLLFAALPGIVLAAEADRRFEELTTEYLKGHFAFRPSAAVKLGMHEYDGLMPVYGQASLDAEYARLQAFDKQLAVLPMAELSESARIDYQVLRAAIKEELFWFDGSEAFVRNPMTYPRAFKPSMYLTRSWAPFEDRLKLIIKMERRTPELFANARANLKKPLARAFVETAIKVTDGAASFLEKDVKLAIKDVTDQKLLAEFDVANQIAIKELRGYSQ